MKYMLCFYFLLIVVVTLSGCDSRITTSESMSDTPIPPLLAPTRTQTPHPTNIIVSPTTTLTPIPTQPATSTALPTLEPEQAEEILKALLQGPRDCLVPCFWGIMPGQTTFSEAENIFTSLGLQLEFTNTRDNKEFFEIIYHFESGLSVSPLLTIQDDIVKNLRIYITPEKNQEGMPREWIIYSPQTLITQYGLPTRVDFFIDYPGDADAKPKAWYWMVMYFETADFIIEYGRPEIAPPLSLLPICPLTDNYDSVYLWLGKDPEYPPQFGIPLEEASSLTIEEFAELMTGDPENACFELKNDAFPQGFQGTPP